MTLDDILLKVLEDGPATVNDIVERLEGRVRIRLNMLRARGVVIREGRGGAHREFTYKLLRAGRCREGGPREGSRARSARTAVARRLAAATALSVRPSLAAFFDQQPNDRQRGDTVDPPRANNPLSDEAHDDDH